MQNLKVLTGLEECALFAETFISFAHHVIEYSGSVQAALVLLTQESAVESFEVVLKRLVGMKSL